jgi:hypothetical protein
MYAICSQLLQASNWKTRTKTVFKKFVLYRIHFLWCCINTTYINTLCHMNTVCWPLPPLIFCLFHSSLNCATLFCNFYELLHTQLSFWLPSRSMEFKYNLCMHVCIYVASKGYSMVITTSSSVNRMARLLRKNTGKYAWWGRVVWLEEEMDGVHL